MAEKTIDPIISKAIKTIDFIFNEYEQIFSEEGIIIIDIPHYLYKKQRKEIVKYYQEKCPFTKIEAMIVRNYEDNYCTTSFKFRKNN